MGSLENGLALKRPPLMRSCHTNSGRLFFHRPRSRLTRFFLFEKVDYVQLVCTAVAFFFVVMLIQAFLPASVVEKSGTLGMSAVRRRDGVLREIGGLDFGEGIRFEPSTLLERFQKEKAAVNFSSPFGRPARRAALVRPRIGLVLADLSVDASQLQMVTIAVALREIGYDVEVYAFEDGPVRSIWISAGFSLSIFSSYDSLGAAVDWSNYNGILLNSLEAKPILSSLSQDPFKFLPVVWTIHEKALALRLNHYITTNKTQLIKDWKQAFSRATVVVFPNQFLTMMYSIFDIGNYYVIPGSPAEAWRANNYLSLHGSQDPRPEMGYKTEDFIIAVVGSQFPYSGLFLEHALILESLATILPVFSSPSQVKIGILHENLRSTHNQSLEEIALKLGFLRGSVNQIGFDRDFSSFLGISDVVIYGSFLEEHHFPSILVQAMCLRKLVIAPDLAMITKHVDDSVHGYTFPRQNVSMLAQILTQAIPNGKLSYSAKNVASTGKTLARKLMVSQVVEGYALLLENILKFPSEVEIPKDVGEIPLKLKEEWQWSVFESIMHGKYLSNNSKKTSVVDKLEKKWSLTQIEGSSNHTDMIADEAFISIDWREERTIEIENARKRLLQGELKDRTDQPHGTWDEVYRNVKRAERTKNEYLDRDDRDLERIGQPLCIYEPYFGEGTWPFLHNTSLYRGIGLSTKGRRPGGDDIDATSRLPILKHDYHRDALGEHGAFFALAYRIDRIHKNAWIGFQSWRLSAQKKSLTKKAEGMLVKAIESQRHGDALYFWVSMDRDPRNPLQQDFWSFCDALNAGNCRFAVSRALRKMYGMPPEWDSLPSMPAGGGDSWCVMHSWALPTRSFLEFVMFSRMFIDALDSEMYDEHHQSGTCYLSLWKDRHCYSRVLELLVNVWAYHSPRRMVHVNPETGEMEEQHRLQTRRGHMWIQWFSLATLKGMDEDRAEEFDTENSSRRWLWPSTGEVFWQGMYERERSMRQQQRERRKQRNREKIRRMKTRAKQKTLGKYVKPSSPYHTNTTALH